MSNFTKKKNGFKITVKNWDNKINVENLKTGEVVTSEFEDHIVAVYLAKKL